MSSEQQIYSDSFSRFNDVWLDVKDRARPFTVKEVSKSVELPSAMVRRNLQRLEAMSLLESTSEPSGYGTGLTYSFWVRRI